MLVHVQNTHAFTLFARTQEDKENWIQTFREALDNAVPRNGASSPHEVPGSML
jgi:hypothetical protein